MSLEQQFVEFCEAQVYDKYILGYEVPYSRWTLSDPSNVWDCSELVEVAYGRFGIKIRDLAAYQYQDTVAITDTPRIGDLVFLKNNPDRPGGIGHVGIYVGNGTIIEAKGSAYGVVRTSLAVWKAKNTYAGMRRYPAFTAAMQTGSITGGVGDMRLLDPVPVGLVRVYRLRDGRGDYLFTTSVDEANKAQAFGYTFEGPAFDLVGDNPKPIYRLNKDNFHHYASSEEAAGLVTAQGWVNEGVAFHVANDGTPVYRAAKGAAHIFTVSAAEARSVGMTYEGVAFMCGILKVPAATDTAALQKAAADLAALKAKLRELGQ